MKKFFSILLLACSLTLILSNLAFAKPLFINDYNIFAKNELVLAISRDNPGKISNFNDLGKKGIRLSIGNPKSVPAGNYTMRVLKNLEDINPALKQAIVANIVSQESVVLAVLDKLVNKEVDAGFVFLSNVQEAGDKVKMIPIPKNIQVTDVFFPIGLLKESKNPKLAKEFIKYVNSKQGQAILVKYGFKAARKLPFTYEKTATPLSNKELTVYAAGSLKTPFTEIAQELEKIYGAKINFQFASSGALKTKIQNGAPADIFACADMENMLDLAK